jgi:formamidopyrimidine-DNA glycosylase
LGIEPLSRAFTHDALRNLTSASQSPIKMLLMDQRRIAGIGNIYAAEALWRSGISPARRSSSLSHEEVLRLHDAVVSVLEDAIAQQGTSLGKSISDYIAPSGDPAEFQNHLSVYGREAEPCERCGGTILRIKQGGRSTYYCDQCQH